MRSVKLGSIVLYSALLLSGWSLAESPDSEVLLKALDANNDQMVQAFVEGDADAFATCWTPDLICMIDQVPMLCGSQQLRNVFMDATAGSNMRGLERLDRHVWISGSYVYETGRYVHQFSAPNKTQVVSDFRTFVTVWQPQSDGSWKRAIEVWAGSAVPSMENLAKWRKQTHVDIPLVDMNKTSTGPAVETDKSVELVTGLEKVFHDYFLSEDPKPAADIYAEDAWLMSMSQDWTVGREQIRESIAKGRQDTDLVNIDREVVLVGGDGDMIHVVNRFHWQFKLPATGEQIHDMYGKGLHVWQRQPDSEWKILIDINNMNPPPGVNP